MEKNNVHSDEVYLAQWLEGRISDDELKAFVSEEDINAYMKLRKGLDVYEALESPLDSTLTSINNKIEAKQTKQRSYKAWVIAAAASVVLFFGLFTILNDDTFSIETQLGEQKTIALLDGSEVQLNSKSSIRYDASNWKTNRSLYLEGEAYFKVKKGSTFTVNTANGSVEVLGTQFNVNSTADYFQVVCYEGKVSVINDDNDYVLTPNHNLRRINGHPIETWESTIKEPSWIHGESTFRSVPIKYVISALEAQYDVTFDTKKINKSTIFTGSFGHNSLDVALKTVFGALQIQYFEKEKKSIQLSPY